MKHLRILAAALALLLIGLSGASAMAEGSSGWLETVLSERGGAASTQTDDQNADQGSDPVSDPIEVRTGAKKPGMRSGAAKQPAHYLAVLDIDSEISEYDSYYDHIGVLDAIDDLMEDENNDALILRLNTPGGNLYEADELYHSLMLYKQLGRPVYAYMEQECCSAGVYVAMAADTIMAARMTITGNVGVYMQTYSEAGLLDKLGIENEYIATGENKVAGYPELTDTQRAIYQALVDESFALFKAAIMASRGMTQEQMAPFLDGRLLSAMQAKELGLIDRVCFPDEFYAHVEALHPGAQYRNVTPEAPYAGSLLDMLGGGGLTDILDLIGPGAMKNDSADRQKSALRSSRD